LKARVPQIEVRVSHGVGEISPWCCLEIGFEKDLVRLQIGFEKTWCISNWVLLKICQIFFPFFFLPSSSLDVNQPLSLTLLHHSSD